MPRNRKEPEHEHLLEVARLRFVDGLDNVEIAHRLKIGRKQVAARLKQSVTWLIDQQQRFASLTAGEPVRELLEQQLMEKYTFLRKVKVVPRGKLQTGGDYSELKQRLAVEAAKYFDEIVESGEFRDKDRHLHVSISGGEFPLAVMNALPDHARVDVYFYASAFLGRGPESKFHIDPATNATIGWLRSGRLAGNCVYATISPCELDFKSTAPYERRKNNFMEEVARSADNSIIEGMIGDLDNVTVSFAGLGMVVREGRVSQVREPTASDLLTRQGVAPQELAKDGAVGDIAYCFFDKDGTDPKGWRFFVTGGYNSGHSGLEYYRRMVKQEKRVVMIAGPFELPAILAALKGKLFNVWFTDEITADEVLKAK